ncbi:hypothetical protein EJB05_01799, partial [Eragrostis curvula]
MVSLNEHDEFGEVTRRPLQSVQHPVNLTAGTKSSAAQQHALHSACRNTHALRRVEQGQGGGSRLRKRHLVKTLFLIVFLIVYKLIVLTAPDGVEQVPALVLAGDEVGEPLEDAGVLDLPRFGLLYHAVDPDQQAADPLQFGFGALLVAETPGHERDHSADGFANDGRDDRLRHGEFFLELFRRKICGLNMFRRPSKRRKYSGAMDRDGSTNSTVHVSNLPNASEIYRKPKTEESPFR